MAAIDRWEHLSAEDQATFESYLKGELPLSDIPGTTKTRIMDALVHPKLQQALRISQFLGSLSHSEPFQGLTLLREAEKLRQDAIVEDELSKEL